VQLERPISSSDTQATPEVHPKNEYTANSICRLQIKPFESSAPALNVDHPNMTKL